MSTGGFDAAVRSFTQQAIAPSTHRAYGKAVERYIEWGKKRGIDTAAQKITVQSAANWLASLGEEGELQSNTIKAYRSALSTWWKLSLPTGAVGPNPLSHDTIDLTLKGIARARQQQEAQRRAAKALHIEVTPELLAAVEHVARGPRPQDDMKWAAACVATYGLLRPNEFLGSAQARKEALRPEAIAWFARHNSVLPGGMLPPGDAVDGNPLPDHFTIDLGPTKADQQGRNDPVPIRAATAVKALWRWMHRRRDLGPARGSPLFCVPNESPLSLADLCRSIADWVEATGQPRPSISGKAFRRGGASAMVAAGAASADIAAAGRWRSAAMINVYANAASKHARRLRASAAMDPSARRGGAAP